MMIRAAVLLSAAMALPLSAEGLPVFDETLGFEISGLALDGGLLVNNAGQGFFCDVDDSEKATHLVLRSCIPFLGPLAAAALNDAPSADGPLEAGFVAGLETLPEPAFTPAIVDAFTEMGCVIDFNGGEDAFIAEVAHQLARSTGYTGPVTDVSFEAVKHLSEPAADAMVEQGRIVLDRDAMTATFTECQ